MRYRIFGVINDGRQMILWQYELTLVIGKMLCLKSAFTEQLHYNQEINVVLRITRWIIFHIVIGRTLFLIKKKIWLLLYESYWM